MSSDDIEPFDWSRRFFDRKGFFGDMFRGFDEMRREFDKQRLQLHQVLVGRKVTSRQKLVSATCSLGFAVDIMQFSQDHIIYTCETSLSIVNGST